MSEANPAAQNGDRATDSAVLHLGKAYASMIAATLLWSSNAVAVKLILREMPQIATAVIRVTLAASILAGLYLLQGGRFRLRPGEAWTFLKLSLPGPALSFLFFTLGLNNTSIFHAVFIGALVPIAVLALARLDSQEPITPLKFAGLLLSLVGVLFLALDQAAGPDASWKGDLFVGVGVWCFAFYTTRAKRIAPSYPSLQFNTYCFLGGVAWLAPLLLLELGRLPWSRIGWVGWTSLLYSASLGSAGAYLAFYYALRFVEASRVAAFHYLQPVLASIFGVWVLHESWTTMFVPGAALILAGVFLAERR